MAKKETYFKKNSFIDYLDKKVGRPGQYAGYIDSILKNVLEPLGCGVLIYDIEPAIQYEYSYEKVFEGLDIVYSFLKKLVWISKNVRTNNRINEFLSENKLNLNSINNWPSVINKYKDFLNICDIARSTSIKKQYKVSNWNDAIKKLEKVELDILSLKGTDSLLAQFQKNYSGLLSIVLNDSYFLSSELAESRFKYIAAAIQQKKCLYARESKKSNTQSNNVFYYKSEIDTSSKSINIEIDSDGNSEVKNLLLKETGYTVSAGYNSIFQHYIISHIWGDAFDPRNFTNYWNIVIVPAWANFLLDKQGSQDELAKCFINTFKEVCIKHYKMKKMDWNSIDKDYKNLMPDMDYVVKGEYSINMIMDRKNNSYGRIKSKKIHI